MAKTAYSATDANGTVHTRKSDRGYTHTVVARKNLEALIAQANDKGWQKVERSNYAYAQQIASGNDPHTRRNYSGTEAEQVRVDAENAKRVADAKATISVSLEQYLENNRLDRVARAEATDLTVFHNLGWCGRPDLAQNLARKSAGGTWCDITILEAVRG